MFLGDLGPSTRRWSAASVAVLAFGAVLAAAACSDSEPAAGSSAAGAPGVSGSAGAPLGAAASAGLGGAAGAVSSSGGAASGASAVQPQGGASPSGGATVVMAGAGSGGAAGTASAGSGGSAGHGGASAGGGTSAGSGGGGGSAIPTFSSAGDGNSEIASPFSLPAESTRLSAGASAGRVQEFTFNQSKVFPGTSRVVRVYTPAGHDGSQPAALSVLQDGNAYISNFRMPMVLDNLIAAREVPAQIAVFIDASANRSAEYDCLNDNYHRFVTEEILPEVERRYSVKISADPWQRAIGGHSSGGSAAFTVGFRHPESFRRILTHNGSFTNLCSAGSPSAHTYPSLIAAAEPKPLRVFLLTGTGDNGAGTNGNRDWVKMNRDMAAALAMKAYHYRFVFANGGTHSQNAGASVLPDTLRWLWRAPL